MALLYVLLTYIDKSDSSVGIKLSIVCNKFNTITQCCLLDGTDLISFLSRIDNRRRMFSSKVLYSTKSVNQTAAMLVLPFSL